jgi:hypothetical protein
MKAKEKFKNSQVEVYTNNKEVCHYLNTKNKNKFKKTNLIFSIYKENKLKKQNQILN